MNFSVDKMMLLLAESEMEVKELCERAGIATITYNKIKNKECRPKPATIGKIARALNVKVKDLLED